MDARRATQELLEAHRSPPSSQHRARALAALVLRHGSLADARALLPAFVTEPEKRSHLVSVLARYGDGSTAAQLVEHCFADGRLRAGMPSQVLHAVGCLGHPTAERLLWRHLDGDWDTAKQACLGLLQLPCTELATDIGEALRLSEGKALFSEFLPALATKTGDASWLKRLVAWGDTRASTDCNGGLLLGIALHGEPAVPHFLRILWDRRWEAGDSATGSRWWAYAGARVLGLRIEALFPELNARLAGTDDVAQRRHCVQIFTSLVELWASRPWLGLTGVGEPEESCEALHQLLFSWSTPHRDDSVVGRVIEALGHGDPLVQRLYVLRNELELRAAHELELRHLG